MKKVIVATLLLLPAFVHSASWKYVANTQDMTMQIDFDSITTKKNGIRKAWKEMRFIEPQPLPGASDKYQRVLVLTQFDCDDRMTSVLQEVYYDSLENGRSIRSIDHNPKNISFREVVPESIEEASLNAVCSFRTKK